MKLPQVKCSECDSERNAAEPRCLNALCPSKGEPMDICVECGIDVPDGAGCAGYDTEGQRVAYCSPDAVKVGAFADEYGNVTTRE